VGVHTITIGLVISPFSLINVTFSMNQSSLSVSHSISPEAVVSASIRPNLDTSSVFLVLFNDPLSLVNCPVLKDTNGPNLSLLSVFNILLACPVKIGELLNNFKNNLVVVVLVEDFQLLVQEQVKVVASSLVPVRLLSSLHG